MDVFAFLRQVKSAFFVLCACMVGGGVCVTLLETEPEATMSVAGGLGAAIIGIHGVGEEGKTKK